MNARDLLRLVVNNLGRMKGRVAMTAIGVVIGTAAVMVLISLAGGMRESALRDLSSIGSLTDINVYPRQALAIFGAPTTGREGVLDDRTLAEFRKLPGVVAVIPKEPLNAPAMLRYGRLIGGTQIVGIDPAQIDYLDFSMASGAARLGSGQVIAGAQVAENFFDHRAAASSRPLTLGAGAPNWCSPVSRGRTTGWNGRCACEWRASWRKKATPMIIPSS